jgi:hypothetical protein
MEIKEYLNNKIDSSNASDTKVHQWRKCGKGKHLVREHVVHVPPSKKHPDGNDAIWHEHCANNPSGKDELSYAEIKYISETHFSKLSGPPTANALTKLFSDADKYDIEIRGWVQYWNDIFQLDDPLDPNVVKALIATESSFIVKPKEHKYVYGLMQITGHTHQYLNGTKKELRDYFVSISTDNLLDASCNICAGVRWLFRKKQTASELLEQKATWEETIEDYKAILALRIHGKPYNPKPMEDFRQYYKILSEG